MRVYEKNTIWDLKTFLFKVQFVNVLGEFAEHQHDFSELFIVMEGSAMHQIAGYIYPIHKGDVYIIKGNTPHAFLDAKELKVCNISYDSRIFLGTEGLVEHASFEDLFLYEPELRANEAYPSMLHLENETIDQILPLCRCCQEQYKKNIVGYASCIRMCFLTIVSLLLQNYEQKRLLHPNALSTLHQARNYMNENFYVGITVEQIASAVHVSPRHLNRIFHQYYHFSVSHHLRMLRMSRAAELLCKTDCSIQDIARECAFEDTSYFSRCFKSTFGETPSIFRKKNRL